MNKKIKASFILSILASICFFISYFINKETLTLILGFAWLCISFGVYCNKKSDN